MMFLRGLPAAVCALALLAPVAHADVTVNLRVEGSDRTLFEGPITTDARTIDARDSEGNEGSFPCNYRENTGGGDEQGTPTTAVYDAMRRIGESFEATWYDSFDDFTVDRLGSDVAGDPDYWGVAVDGQEAQVGGCQVRLDDGDEVLWAYGLFGRPILQLTGPETVQVGQQAIFRVTDSRTGDGVGDVDVAGRATNSEGRVEVTFSDTGEKTVKAEKPGAIRSNAREIEVVPAVPGTAPAPAGAAPGTTASGTSGGPDRTAPRATIASLRSGQVFSRRRAPKLLRGRVAEDSGVLMVKLRLNRTSGGRCQAYSGRRERFVRRPDCDKGWWFKVGTTPEWEYELPRQLPRGRYVLDVNVVDKAYNRDDARRPGENRVVFHVR